LAQTKVYEKPSEFVRGAFPGGVPAAQTVTLTSAMAKDVKGILGHDYRSGSRITFWKSGARTAWILEEIGKTQPITTGFVIDGGAIASVQVLVYRESHGWEVERPFFTRQFAGARLTDGRKLTKRIDGIAGATLSVRSLTRLAAMALYLDAAVSRP
jgi:hypothetical protein